MISPLLSLQPQRKLKHWLLPVSVSHNSSIELNLLKIIAEAKVFPLGEGWMGLFITCKTKIQA